MRTRLERERENENGGCYAQIVSGSLKRADCLLPAQFEATKRD